MRYTLKRDAGTPERTLARLKMPVFRKHKNNHVREENDVEVNTEVLYKLQSADSADLLHRDGKKDLVVYRGEKNHVVVSDLMPNTLYRFWLCSVTRHTKSPWSKPFHTMTAPSKPAQPVVIQWYVFFCMYACLLFMNLRHNEMFPFLENKYINV